MHRHDATSDKAFSRRPSGLSYGVLRRHHAARALNFGNAPRCSGISPDGFAIVRSQHIYKPQVHFTDGTAARCYANRTYSNSYSAQPLTRRRSQGWDLYGSVIKGTHRRCSALLRRRQPMSFCGVINSPYRPYHPYRPFLHPEAPRPSSLAAQPPLLQS